MAIRVSIPSVHTYHLKGPCAVECYYKDQHIWGRLPLSVAFKTKSKEPVVVVAMAYIHRKDDDGTMITHPCGSAWIDLSTVNYQDLRETPLIDHTINQQVGLIRWSFDFAFASPPAGPIESNTLQRLSEMSESNLRWIAPFHSRGFPPIVSGLKTVHSPYYTNHLGIRMPSGAFTLTRTLRSRMEDQIAAFDSRLTSMLVKHGMSSSAWNVEEPEQAHLEVLVDFLTMQTNQRVHYTPDVSYREDGSLVGCERWECPRSDDGVHTGDCEDVAKEIFQQCKEIKALFQPRHTTNLESVSYLLHVYIPTIEQGAVTAAAHSRFALFDGVSYRNHIWAALHPRSRFKKDIQGPLAAFVVQGILDSYKVVPKQKWERKLPRLLLEGTGMVYPTSTEIVDNSKIAKRQHDLEKEMPILRSCQTIDFYADRCQFYKYSIACMTDVFYNQGILDFTYIHNKRYGIPFADWYNSKAITIHANNKLSSIEMDDIDKIIDLDRPIPPLTERVAILQKPTNVTKLTYSICNDNEAFQDIQNKLQNKPKQIIQYQNKTKWTTWFV